MRLALALALAGTLSAHRLDEYLQATLISIEPESVRFEITLTPGVGVAKVILAMIDTDSDGQLSSLEQQAYARKALDSMALEFDGAKLQLTLDESTFPDTQLIRDGLGAIRLTARASLPPSWRFAHNLHFTNRHASSIAAYLVNCLAPNTDGLTIQRQTRDYLQSSIQVTYKLPNTSLLIWWLAGSAVVLLAFSARRLRSAIQSP